MIKVLIWGTGEGYNRYYNLIKMYESKGEISVVGLTSNEFDIVDSLDDYTFYEKSEIHSLEYDYCIVTIKNYRSLEDEAYNIGIKMQQIIPARVMEIPYFSFPQYIKMKEDGLSIISCNCWAGLCYHYLSMEFLSPTINLHFSSKQFNRFVSHLDYYLDVPLTYKEMKKNENTQTYFPVGCLDDIEIFFLHYDDFDGARMSWEKRKRRMVNNKLIISSTMDRDVAEEFSKLPFENKYIFVPREMNIRNTSVIPVECRDEQIGKYSNRVACGTSAIISPFLMCCGAQFKRDKR